MFNSRGGPAYLAIEGVLPGRAPVLVQHLLAKELDLLSLPLLFIAALRVAQLPERFWAVVDRPLVEGSLCLFVLRRNATPPQPCKHFLTFNLSLIDMSF